MHYKKGIDLGLAERFSDSIIDVNVSEKIKQKMSSSEQTLFSLESNAYSKLSRFEDLKNEVFEKIVNVPCWFEYDEKTQKDLIIKFLVAKNIKNPDVFAKVLQHSILGFGVFDDYLAQEDVSAIHYIENEPLVYTKNNVNITDNMIIPLNKVKIAVRNIINMSQSSKNVGAFDFRFGNYWVELRNFSQAKIKLSVEKIDNVFLEEQFKASDLASVSLEY